MPYTYAIRFSGNPKEYHYYGVEGSVAVGDVFVTPNYHLAEVTKIDTNNDRANKYFVAQKLDEHFEEYKG